MPGHGGGGASALSSASQTAERSRTMDEFEQLGDLGRGGCATVTKVRCRRSGELFALKVIDRRSRPELKTYIDSEVATQQSLWHADIIRLYDSFEDGQRVCLLLEYAPNGSLFSRIRAQGRLQEREAAETFSCVLRALAHLHERGVAHRDLKPENVLLFSEGVAKLADFGWCANISSRSSSGSGASRHTFCGTMDYLSPEMVAQRPHDHSVDLWAAGVLLFEMLEGKTPFASSNPAESLQSILAANFEVPEEYRNKGAGDLIKGFLRLQPHERLSARVALQQSWLRLDETGGSAKSVSSQQSRSAVADTPTPLRSSVRAALLTVVPDLDVPVSAQTSASTAADEPTGRKFLSPVSIAEKHDSSRSSSSRSPARADVPKIGGLATLEGIVEKRVTVGNSNSIDFGVPASGVGSSFVFQTALRPASGFESGILVGSSPAAGGVAARKEAGLTSSEALLKLSARHGLQDFLLTSCLSPAGDAAGFKGASWVDQPAWPTAAQRRCAANSSAQNTKEPATTPRSWRQHGAYAAVQNWVRLDTPRGIAKELDDALSSAPWRPSQNARTMGKTFSASTASSDRSTSFWSDHDLDAAMNIKTCF